LKQNKQLKHSKDSKDIEECKICGDLYVDEHQNCQMKNKNVENTSLSMNLDLDGEVLDPSSFLKFKDDLNLD
jgi:hypothetical protein